MAYVHRKASSLVQKVKRQLAYQLSGIAVDVLDVYARLDRGREYLKDRWIRVTGRSIRRHGAQESFQECAGGQEEGSNL